MLEEKNRGSSFASFLQDEGIEAEVQAEAMKKIISLEIKEHLKTTKRSKIKFASSLHSSRSQVDRLLDPKNTSVTLKTLSHAASAMGKKLVVGFE